MSRRPITPSSASRLTGMLRCAPAPDLADVIEHHWIVRWEQATTRPAVRHEVLPDPSVNLAVEPAGRLLYGVGGSRFLRELSGSGTVIGTKFRPGGFSGFRPGSVSAITGRVLTLSDAFGADGAELDAVLDTVRDVSSTIAAISSFLRARKPPPHPSRALVMDVVRAMRSAPPGAQVADLAAAFAVSPRTLQRLFIEHVGTPPKQVLQRFRRQHAIDRLASDLPLDLSRLAAELGYYDQAHLARDFRRTLARSPSSVAASE